MTQILTHTPLWVFGLFFGLVYLGFKSITDACEVPICIHNTIAAGSSGRSPNAEIVLRAAVHAIKRKRIVRRYFIKLCDG